MKRILLLVVIVMASGALLAGGWIVYYLHAPRQTPAGQPPLVSLSQQGLAALREDFNRDPGAIRVLAMLSPT